MSPSEETRTGYSRRWLLSRSAFVGAVLVAPAAAAAAGARTAAAATPTTLPAALATVDMELALLGCQVDPPKPNSAITPGAEPHVRLVEQALSAEGLLDASRVDGHFGSTTVAAYAAWQRRLGFTGIDANGVPGRTSLTRLGTNRFEVVNPVLAGSRTDSYTGRRTNTRTVDMLRRADGLLSWGLTLTQGSYTSANPGSAGTHSGGGVVDISVSGLSTTQRWQTVQALRTVGFAAWLRTPDQGFAYHIHAVGISDPDLSEPARNQVHDYYFGRNGLASHAADNTPAAYRMPFTWWERYLRS